MKINVVNCTGLIKGLIMFLQQSRVSAKAGWLGDAQINIYEDLLFI